MNEQKFKEVEDALAETILRLAKDETTTDSVVALPAAVSSLIEFKQSHTRLTSD